MKPRNGGDVLHALLQSPIRLAPSILLSVVAGNEITYPRRLRQDPIILEPLGLHVGGQTDEESHQGQSQG